MLDTDTTKPDGMPGSIGVVDCIQRVD